MEHLKKATLISFVLLGLSALLGLNPIRAVTSGALGIQPADPDPTQLFSASWFIYTSGLGQKIKDRVDVINLADEPMRVRVWAADGTTTPDGAYTIKEGNTDIGTWVTFSGEEERILNLKARETRTIDFILKVPVNAEVGDHLGAIMVQAIEMEEGLGKGEAEVESELKVVTRIGARVYLTVSGKIVRALEFLDFSSERRSPIHHFVLTLKNPGNVRIEPEGEIAIKNILGAMIDEIKIPNRVIFPKDEIVLPVKWEKTSIFGKFTAKASVNSEAGEVLTKELTFWIFPPLNVLLRIGFGIIILALLVKFLVGEKRKRRRLLLRTRIRTREVILKKRRRDHTQVDNEVVLALKKIITKISNKFKLNKKNYKDWLDRDKTSKLGQKVLRNSRELVTKIGELKRRVQNRWISRK